MFTDIHSHIIPGIDDGAADMNVSLDMLRIACENGTSHIIATPHYIQGTAEISPLTITEKCKELEHAAGRKGLSVSVHSGAEAFVCPELPELARDGAVPSLNGTKYILIEMPMISIPSYVSDVIYRLKLYGFNPIIAHPERNNEIRNNPNLLYDFVYRGAFVQVNASSITGLYGRKINMAAMTLLKHNLVHFVASDAHSCRGRSPNLKKAFDIVGASHGLETARRLFVQNGLTMLEDCDIDGPEPKKIESCNVVKKFFLNAIKFGH